MRDILVVCPQERDLRAIEAAGLAERYRIRYAGSDLDQLAGFDPVAFVDDWVSMSRLNLTGIWPGSPSR